MTQQDITLMFNAIDDLLSTRLAHMRRAFDKAVSRGKEVHPLASTSADRVDYLRTQFRNYRRDVDA